MSRKNYLPNSHRTEFESNIKKIEFGDWHTESNRKSERHDIADLKATLELKSKEMKIHDKSSPREGRKSSQGLGDLTDDLNRLREAARNKISSPYDASSNSARFGGTENQPEQNDRFDKIFDISPENVSIKHKHHSWKEELRKRNFAEIVSLGKIFALQDGLTDVSDREFNELPAELVIFKNSDGLIIIFCSYIEEMIKLSSIIMHRVKSSDYYNSKA